MDLPKVIMSQFSFAEDSGKFSLYVTAREFGQCFENSTFGLSLVQLLN